MRNYHKNKIGQNCNCGAAFRPILLCQKLIDQTIIQYPLKKPNRSIKAFIQIHEKPLGKNPVSINFFLFRNIEKPDPENQQTSRSPISKENPVFLSKHPFEAYPIL